MIYLNCDETDDDDGQKCTCIIFTLKVGEWKVQIFVTNVSSSMVVKLYLKQLMVNYDHKSFVYFNRDHTANNVKMNKKSPMPNVQKKMSEFTYLPIYIGETISTIVPSDTLC